MLSGKNKHSALTTTSIAHQHRGYCLLLPSRSRLKANGHEQRMQTCMSRQSRAGAIALYCNKQTTEPCRLLQAQLWHCRAPLRAQCRLNAEPCKPLTCHTVNNTIPHKSGPLPTHKCKSDSTAAAALKHTTAPKHTGSRQTTAIHSDKHCNTHTSQAMLKSGSRPAHTGLSQLLVTRMLQAVPALGQLHAIHRAP